MRATLGMVRQLLGEGRVHLREPQTPEQKKAFLDLVAWATSRMMVPDVEKEDALQKAREDDYREALQLLQTFYYMKGIKAQVN